MANKLEMHSQDMEREMLKVYTRTQEQVFAILQALLQSSTDYCHTRRALEQMKYCSMDVLFKLSCSVFHKPFFIPRTAQVAAEMYCIFICFQECIFIIFWDKYNT
jgi:hypothetical protein